MLYLSFFQGGEEDKGEVKPVSGKTKWKNMKQLDVQS